MHRSFETADLKSVSLHFVTDSFSHVEFAGLVLLVQKRELEVIQSFACDQKAGRMYIVTVVSDTRDFYLIVQLARILSQSSLNGNASLSRATM